MKFKYYLRGAGVGILVSTIVLMIAFSIKGNNLSDDEIISRAKKLGMVESTESNTVADSKDKKDKSEKKTTSKDDSNTSTDDKSSDYTLVIESGEVPRTVINRLIDEGLVQDYDEFSKVLHNKGYDSDILPGTYSIPRDSSYDEIAEILRPNK